MAVYSRHGTTTRKTRTVGAPEYPGMDPRASLHLDLMRFLAAALVLMHHALQPPFSADPVPLPGRSAVIVFFVISGFVIAYVTDTRESRWREYAVSRSARIYSVVVPALAPKVLRY